MELSKALLAPPLPLEKGKGSSCPPCHLFRHRFINYQFSAQYYTQDYTTRYR